MSSATPDEADKFIRRLALFYGAVALVCASATLLSLGTRSTQGWLMLIWSWDLDAWAWVGVLGFLTSMLTFMAWRGLHLRRPWSLLLAEALEWLTLVGLFGIEARILQALFSDCDLPLLEIHGLLFSTCPEYGDRDRVVAMVLTVLIGWVALRCAHHIRRLRSAPIRYSVFGT